LKNNHFLAATFLSVVFLVSACGGGGNGGGGGFGLNGGPVGGAVSWSSPPATYTFNVEADKAYTVSVVTVSGSTDLYVYNGSATGSWIGSSSSSLSTTPYNTVSFIATFTGTVTAVVSDWSFSTAGSSYSIQAFEGTLPIGTSRTASTYNDTINYSFDAVGGTAYQVRLTPQTGNVDIGSVNAKLTASVGSSALTGTSMDTVTFLAPATQRYYVRVDPKTVDTTFNIQVVQTTVDPDLSVMVNSAVSDGTNVTVNYTVLNNGLSAAGSFGITGWSNSASTPTVGSTGQASATHSSLPSGASVSGSLIIPNVANSGTAYVIVDTEKAVLEANETNNISAGMAWEKPLMAPQDFTFESGSIPTGLKMSGNANWVIDASTGSVSTKSLKAGTITALQSSCVAANVANGATISFDYAVGSDYGDYLKFYIDGLEQSLWASGTVNWTHYTNTVTTAPHEYKWCYTKDSYWTTLPDTAWIDNIVVAPASVDLQVAITSAVSNGTNVTINYTVTNAGNTASGPFNVDVWANALTVPAVGTTGNSLQAHTSLAAGASAYQTVTIDNASASGSAYAVVDAQNTVMESDETNNVSSGQAWASAVDLRVTVNSAVSNGASVTVNYTVSNSGTMSSGPFNVDVWGGSSAPAVGMTGDGSTAHTSLSAGASATGTVTVANASASGTAFAVVDTQNTVGEFDETNNVSNPGQAWVAPPLVATPVTYDFQDSLVPAVMVMSGDAPWANVSGGGNARVLKAGTVLDSQTSCVVINASGSSSISFDYSVSSEAGYDYLKFYIDGVQQGTGMSGTVAWTASGVIAAGTTGTHEYKWCYMKDGSMFSGSDTAWIDNIVIN
jgi:hypothetical protein